MGSSPTSRSASRMLTIADVAAHLQLSIKSVRRLIDRQALPVHRFGRQVRIAPHDLAAFIHHSREEVSL